MPVDVGEAVVDYLCARGRDRHPTVFVKVQAPAGPLSRYTVKEIVHRACVRAGVPVIGAHRLRSTAATAMLAHGATLDAIAQVLRHRDVKTTAGYAKVDRDRLRLLARPWPGARR